MPAVIEVPPIVQEFMVADATSEVTFTTTIRLDAAVPIAAAVYVATLETAVTPDGFAVRVITTEILVHHPFCFES